MRSNIISCKSFSKLLWSVRLCRKQFIIIMNYKTTSFKSYFLCKDQFELNSVSFYCNILPLYYMLNYASITTVTIGSFYVTFIKWLQPLQLLLLYLQIENCKNKITLPCRYHCRSNEAEVPVHFKFTKSNQLLKVYFQNIF